MKLKASVVVLGYGKEAHLESCLDALAAELQEDDELLLVDNGIEDADLRQASWPACVKVIGDGTNLGFAGGCNYGVSGATGDVLVLVNSDAIVRRGSVKKLAATAAEPGIGLVGGCLRLADEPDRVNSAGNPLHFLGVTWAGACGELAAAHMERKDVAVATGGFLAIRREVWEELGGFDPVYFAYHEDADLSLRCWLSGQRVTFEPEAVADHHYDFSRNALKMYLVERNRLVTVLTDYPRSLLVAILPILLLLEPVFLVVAIAQGWPVQKLRSWWWLITHTSLLRKRRRTVQSKVTIRSADIAELMCSRLEPPMIKSPPGMGAINAVLAVYWSMVLRSLRREDPAGGSD